MGLKLKFLLEPLKALRMNEEVKGRLTAETERYYKAIRRILGCVDTEEETGLTTCVPASTQPGNIEPRAGAGEFCAGQRTR
jgi:hypothetical protein